MTARDIAFDTPFHASAVALHGRGLLILGGSGSGKSSLALELCALGATLVGDDRIMVAPPASDADPLIMQPPAPLEGLIEARGVGLLDLPWAVAPLAAVVYLDRTEAARLPERHEIVILGRAHPLLYRVESSAFPAMLAAFLKGHRHAP